MVFLKYIFNFKFNKHVICVGKSGHQMKKIPSSPRYLQSVVILV